MDIKAKIFIIDQDEQSSVIIRHYLQDLDFNVDIETFANLSEIEESVNEDILNIFIISADENTEQLIDEVNDFEQKNNNCKFIISSYNLKPDYIVRFLRNSKKDFIDKPVIQSNLLNIINEIVEKKTSIQDFSGQGKVISVFSNKGGLGKTTIAVNLAMELAESEPYEKAVLVDMNMFLGDVTTFLDMNPPYDIEYISQKAKQNEDISELATQYGDSNLYIIADSPYRDFSNNIDKMSIVSLFNVLRKQYKYIVVDGSSSITEKMKYLFDFSDLILLISEANLPTLRNCKKCLDLFERIKVSNKTELILNRYSYNDECTIENIEEVLQKNVYAVIPNDWNNVKDSINRGITIGENRKNTDIYEAFSELAKMVSEKLCR